MEKTVLNPDAQRRLDDLKASFQKKCGTNPINKLMYGRILEWWNWLDWSVIFDEYRTRTLPTTGTNPLFDECSNQALRLSRLHV